ncbi:hypothetical protein BV898_09509 [Hypsibius exemplaris]|uniref:Uncharacterized protein n=1 Tax=Hypsibius exemplaris TaxID=2072580 RepID=A0A1W0WMD4_HYPEX|nr:hypothetical protein BV898_09509 [Hypsibius exemplaris]
MLFQKKCWSGLKSCTEKQCNRQLWQHQAGRPGIELPASGGFLKQQSEMGHTRHDMQDDHKRRVHYRLLRHDANSHHGSGQVHTHAIKAVQVTDHAATFDGPLHGMDHSLIEEPPLYKEYRPREAVRKGSVYVHPHTGAAVWDTTPAVVALFKLMLIFPAVSKWLVIALIDESG